MPGQADVKPTIVLVHGGFADASSSNGVIKRLQQQDTPSSRQQIHCKAWLRGCHGKGGRALAPERVRLTAEHARSAPAS